MVGNTHGKAVVESDAAPIGGANIAPLSFGQFVGIENWEELSNAFIGLFDQLIAAEVAKGQVDSVKFSTIMEPLVKAFSSRQGIESILLKELPFFHFPF